MEEFKSLDILGFPGYKINKNGVILNLKTGKTFTGSNCTLYKEVAIKDKNGKTKICRVHILVAKMFVPNPDNKPIVNHIDENKHNPCADNLEWVTYKENSNHGTAKQRISEHNAFPVNEYTLQGKYIRTWKNPKYAAKYYGVQPRTIQMFARLKGYSSCGHIWEYYNGNTDDLELDYTIPETRGTRKYNKDKPIPQEYLFEFEDDVTHCDRIINDLLGNLSLSINQKQEVEFLKQYIGKLGTAI